MYITCPSCSTSYEVDGTQIGPQGRTVRCFNCHHSWHQYPVAAQPPMRAAPPPQSARYVPQPAYADSAYMPEPVRPQAYAMPAAAPRAYTPPPPEPMAISEPAPRPAPRPEPVKAAPPPPESKASPAPKPAPPPPVEDMPSDEELDDMLGPVREDAASKAFGGGGRDDTTDIDEEKVAKLPDPEPVRQVYAGTADDDDDLDDDIEPDEIPDPDPIPAVYGGVDDDEDVDDDEVKGGGIKRLIAPAVTIVAIGAIVAGLFLGRDYVVKFVPAANDYVYDLVGLHVMVPGEGLKRELTRTAMETVAEVDHVIATGLITNISDKEQPLPQVVVQLIDANEKVLSSKTMKLEKATLQPGEVLQFKAVFDGAPATARKVRTEWGPFVDVQAQAN